MNRISHKTKVIVLAIVSLLVLMVLAGVIANVWMSTHPSGWVAFNILAAMVIIWAGVCLLVVLKKETVEVEVLIKAMDEFAKGNFTIVLDEQGTGETAQISYHFNRMVKQVRIMFKQVSNQANRVLNMSEEFNATFKNASQDNAMIGKSMSKLNQFAERQVEVAQNGNVQVEALGEAVYEMEQQAQEVNRCVDGVNASVESGWEILRRLTEQAADSRDQSVRSLELVRGLSHQAQSIRKILGKIASISGQTRMLALNASIEAAQAGKYGMGFAVVAQEVSKLADNSRKSVDEITTMIVTMEEQSRHSVDAFQVIGEMISQQSTMVEEVGGQFATIYNSASDINQRMDSFENVVKTIITRLSAMISALADIRQMAEEMTFEVRGNTDAAVNITAMLSQVASSAGELETIAQTLNTTLQVFKVKRESHLS